MPIHTHKQTRKVRLRARDAAVAESENLLRNIHYYNGKRLRPPRVYVVVLVKNTLTWYLHRSAASPHRRIAALEL